jgi:hypothetical protein
VLDVLRAQLYLTSSIVDVRRIKLTQCFKMSVKVKL